MKSLASFKFAFRARSASVLAILAIACLLVLIVLPVFAGSVYDRTVVTVGNTGAYTYTNTWANYAMSLKRIWVISNGTATDTQTITRVTSDGLYTQAVGSVTIATSAGNTASFTAAYLKPSDLLKFSGTAGTNATVMIEYELQQH